jgi:glycosyltransferase involved in cell wall biosynthesis
MITYNHEKYISQAIESVLTQKTNFQIELVIGEDCSTDNTATIIKKYVDRYPETIKARFNSTNLGMMTNVIKTLKECKGKYIAMLEGDDYWTDPFKLQKQVNFLEKNPQYILTGHDAKVINEEGKLLKKTKLPDYFKKDASSADLKKGFWILTLTMCFRNVVDRLPLNQFKVLNADTVLISLLGKYGKGKFIKEIEPAAYRVHSDGIWSGLNPTKKAEENFHTYKSLKDYYHQINEQKIRNYFNKKQNEALLNIFRINIEQGFFISFFRTYISHFFDKSLIFNFQYFFRVNIFVIWYIAKYLFKHKKSPSSLSDLII